MARSPGPTPGRRRAFAVSSPSVCARDGRASSATRQAEARSRKARVTLKMLLSLITVGRTAVARRCARRSSVDAEAAALDRKGAQPSGGVPRPFLVGLDKNAVHLHVTLGHLEARGQ